MARSVRIKAVAKVNLHLRVYNRRADGFHDILSIFQAVSLYDSLVIRSLKGSESIDIEGDFDCPARATTIYRAAEAYRAATGNRTGLSISVDKRIPAGAGLGGGSSDAAATLLGLERLLAGGLELAELQALGASIGSDVPFFLGQDAALVRGRGDIVEAIEARDDFGLLLVHPGFPVSTAYAYGLLDRLRPDSSLERELGSEELVSAYRGDIGLWPFTNSFEAVIAHSRPEIADIKARLLDSGAAFAAMSGSGSTVFGVFPAGIQAEGALRLFRASGFAAWAASPLARCRNIDIE